MKKESTSFSSFYTNFILINRVCVDKLLKLIKCYFVVHAENEKTKLSHIDKINKTYLHEFIEFYEKKTIK